MTREELEFSICEYLDGTLGQSERLALEARLATDPEAQEILRQERALTATLRSGAAPAVKWEPLARRISTAIDHELEDRIARASWALRARSPWFMAVAASIILALAISIHFALTHRGNTGQLPSNQVTGGVAMLIEGPQEETAAGPVVSEVSIGPGGTYAKAPSIAPYADEMDARPTRVAIAAGMSPPAEESSSPSPF